MEYTSLLAFRGPAKALPQRAAATSSQQLSAAAAAAAGMGMRLPAMMIQVFYRPSALCLFQLDSPLACNQKGQVQEVHRGHLSARVLACTQPPC